jgi:hypothetical protein
MDFIKTMFRLYFVKYGKNHKIQVKINIIINSISILYVLL